MLALCFEGHGKLLACVLVIFKVKRLPDLERLQYHDWPLNNPLHCRTKELTYLSLYLEPVRAHWSKITIMNVKWIIVTIVKHRLGYKMWHKRRKPAYTSFVAKAERNSQLARPRHTWNYNIGMDPG